MKKINKFDYVLMILSYLVVVLAVFVQPMVIISLGITMAFYIFNKYENSVKQAAYNMQDRE